MTRIERDFDSWWDYNDPAGTAVKFRARLDARSTVDEYRLELLTQLARTQGLQRNFAAAHAILDEVEPALTEATPWAQVRYHLERGRTFNSSGNKEAAADHFRSAWALAGTIGADLFAVDAAHMLAIVAAGDEQISWNEKALAYAEASDQPRARNWLGSLYNNLGWTYHDMGDYSQALDLFAKALRFHRERSSEERVRIARWCRARCLRSLERYDEALAEQQALAGEYKALGQPSGYVCEELGELLLLTGRAAAAGPYFAQAHALLSQDSWLQANEQERLERLAELGRDHLS